MPTKALFALQKAGATKLLSRIAVVGVAPIFIALSSGEVGAQPAPDSYALVAGERERCADYLELMMRPDQGFLGVSWEGSSKREPSGPPGTSYEGSIVVGAPPTAIHFERRRVLRELEFRYILTFNFGVRVRDARQSEPKLQDIFECKAVQATPNKACLLDEQRLAIKYGLPSLDGERTVPAGKASLVLGNDYHFFRYKERYWLSIAPLASPVSSPLRFGFAMNSPDRVFAYKPPSLFDVGCEIKRNR